MQACLGDGFKCGKSNPFNSIRVDLTSAREECYKNVRVVHTHNDSNWIISQNNASRCYATLNIVAHRMSGSDSIWSRILYK